MLIDEAFIFLSNDKIKICSLLIFSLHFTFLHSPSLNFLQVPSPYHFSFIFIIYGAITFCQQCGCTFLLFLLQYQEGGINMVMKEGTKSITFRLPEEEKFQIEMAAHAENRSVNNWILNVIRNHLKEQKAKK